MPKRELLRKIDQRIGNWVASAAGPSNPGAAHKYKTAGAATATASYNAEGFTASSFVPLTNYRTAKNWNFDTYYSSTAGKVLLDLSATFGIPDHVKAVLVNAYIWDNSGDLAYLILTPVDEPGSGHVLYFYGDDIAYVNPPEFTVIVPCNADGNIYYVIYAGGTNTFKVGLRIIGYFI